MHHLLQGRIAHVWAGLTIVTLISWVISHRGGDMGPNLAVTMAVICIAVAKARFVLREFMEIGHASRWLRILSDVWVVGLPLAIWVTLQI